MTIIALITNIPSPYRVDLFYYMQTHLNDYEIHVIYASENEDNRTWDIDNNKLINSHVLNSKTIKIRGKEDTRYIHIPSNIIKELNSIFPDVVISWEYNPSSLQSLFWCKIHKRKFIHLTDGTLYSERNIGFIQKQTRKIIIRNSDAALASSSKAKEKLLAWGMDKEKIFVSLLTIDIDSICTLKHIPEEGRLLYVGSLIKRKGLDLLFKALEYVEHDYTLRIVGNGSKYQINELSNLAIKSGIQNKVEFCGFKQGDELREEYKRAQIFILPTREDCFGLVLLEALCASVPIISSKYADGAYDIIINGENGVIVDPYDSQSFGKVIENVLDGKIQLNGMKKDLVEKFSFPNVTVAYVNAINYVTKGIKKDE